MRELVGGVPMYRVYGAGKGRKTSVLLELDMAARCAVQSWYVEQAGGDLFMTEGHRPAGIEADRYERVASKTSTGGSNAWYQVGRADRGETPSALPPTGPNPTKHLTGRALDSNAPTARDMKLRAEGAYLAGLVFNVPSETWHEEPLATPRVDLTPWLASVQGTTSTPEEGFLMSLSKNEQSDVLHGLTWQTGGKQKFKIDAVLIAQSENQKALVKSLDTIIDRQLAPNKKWTLAMENRNRLEAVEVEVKRQGELLDAIADKLGVKID